MLKNIKNYAMALAALAIALSLTFMSFTEETNKKEVSSTVTLTDQYWDFVGSGDPLIPNDRENPEHYQLATEDPGCDGSQEICQVKAPADLVADPSGNTPDFTANVTGPNQSVLLRIQNAMSSGANETATLKNTP
ncbi:MULTISPECIES: hypothetical protein [Sphingobacterium]|uniref:hypothetical protein n=1 Tax=Sphingobacterium TaxID=28453 RepID=UPI0013D99385|nr:MULTISPECIES: hypothetical protein [unclassified Sphingobacterium]